MSLFFKFKNSDLKYYCFILLIAILGYFQVSFMLQSLKYDMIDCYYPGRFIVSECLRNHLLPLWNPFQNLGYPLHADPQSGAWYPVVWLLSIFGLYNIYSLHIEFIFHVFIAGTGMFYLARTLQFSEKVALILSISYMFSGFFVGNAQHLTLLISAAWLPFVIASYLKMNKTLNIYFSISTAFFLFMMFSGGYPGLYFILIYFIIILFLYFFIDFILKREYSKIKLLIINNFVIVICFIMFSAVLIISFWQVIPYLSRGEGLSLAKIFYGSFTPQSMMSLVLPFGVIKDMLFFKTDLSMSNAYFGIIPLIFLFLSFFHKKENLFWLFFLFGIFSLLASMGQSTPVRSFLYHHFPLMNLSRFPSMFRLYFIFCMLLSAGFGLQGFSLIMNKKFKLVFFEILLLVIIFTFFIFSILNNGTKDFHKFFLHELWKQSDVSTMYQHLFLQSCVQIIFLIVLILLTILIENRKKLFSIIIIIVISDMFLSAQLNAPYTVYYDNYSVKKVKEHSKIFANDFVLPNYKIIENTDTNGIGYSPFWKNMNNFYNKVACDGFSSFQMKSFDSLTTVNLDLYKSTVNNQLVFLSDKVFPIDSIVSQGKSKSYNSKYIYFPSIVYNKLSKFKFHSSPNDKISFLEFTPIKLKASVHSDFPQILTMLQNYYPGWKIFVNRKENVIYRTDNCFVSTVIPAGDSMVEFKYFSNEIYFGFIVTVLSLIIFVLYVSFKLIYK